MPERIYRVLLLAVVVLTVGASNASAHTTITCESCSRPYQQWVDEAKVPTPDAVIAVVEEPCPELIGDFAWACTGKGTSTIWDALPPPAKLRETFYHELGHNFDYDVLPDWARLRFMTLIHSPASSWTSDPNGPNELFAATYARCATTGPAWRWYPDLAISGPELLPTSRLTYRKLCRMIVTVGS